MPHTPPPVIRRALEQNCLDEECLRITRDAMFIDATDPQFDNLPASVLEAREEALNHMVQDEITCVEDLRTFWSN